MAPEGEQAKQHETAQQAGVSLEAIKAHTQQLAAACAALKAQREARAANVTPTRPDDSQLGRLDSSVKKNGTFIKKLRALGADNGKQLAAEAAKLNLSKYVSEAVIALSEAPLKAADIPVVVDMAAALHQRYPDFAASLGPTLGKVAAGSGAAKAGGTDEERLAARRQRGVLRLLPELVAAGVLPDATPLLTAIKALASTLDFTKAPEPSLTVATLLGSCIKAAGPLLLGAPPDLNPAAAAGGAAAAAGSSGGSNGGCSMPLPQELLHQQDLSSLPPDLSAAVSQLQQQQQHLEEELKHRFQLPAEPRGQLVSLFDAAFEVCSAALVESHKALIALDKDNARAYATKGELPEGAAAEYETSRKNYEALHRGVSSMAEALGKPLPQLAEDAFTRIGHEEAAAAGGGSAGGAGDAVEHVFEDPEARAFYEQLPDLWSLVPTVLLKDATRPRASETSGSKPQDTAADTTAAAAAAAEAEPTAAATAAAAAAATGEASSAGDAGTDADAASKPPAAADAAETDAAAAAEDAAASPTAAAADAAAAAAGGSSGSSEVQGVELILARLPTAVSRDLCDEMAVNFCYSNSKGARKRLVRALLEVPRGNLQLLPYYARVAATISQAYPEVGAGVVSAVEGEFDALALKKDMTRAGEEPRLRVARYLAELVKFRLAAPSSLLLRLKGLLDDFSGPHVEAATTLVENAGRFLLRVPESRVRMENLLAVMMRLRNARNLDSRQTNAIDNAYFACRPPDKAASRRRKRSALQEYIHHLIFERLGDGSIVEVLKKLMKLPWDEAEPYLLKCLLKVVRVRFQHIALIASLAGGLAQYHESLGVGLVDMALEDVRWGLDHPFAGNYQQRLAQVRLLGEAYNYMMLDSRAIFDVLYTLLGYGHDSEATLQKLDPPDDFFRLRMVIVLLNTCGSYFNKGAAKRRLDRFLTFLQAYVLSKQTMPLDVEADLQDMYDVLRPGLVRFPSYGDALSAVGDILAKEAAASASGLEAIDEEDDEDEREEAPSKSSAVEGVDDESEDGGGDGLDEYDRGDEGAGGPLDDEFEREYMNLMQECQGRPGGGSLPGGPGLLPLPTPSSGSTGGSSFQQQQQQQQQEALLLQQVQQQHMQQQYVDEGYGYDEAPGVTFKMLMKRGGKDDRSKELHVPADAALAARVLAQKESEEAERSQIKALVLEANERDEAEQQAAAAAARAARAAAFRRGGGRGYGQQSLYRQRGPGRGPGGRKQGQPGPQLTIGQHVNQLS